MRTWLAGAVCALTLLAAGAAVAATPEDDYIAARDAAIAKIKQLDANGKSDQASAADEKALADLQKRLRGLIGPVAVKGFSGEGKINLQTLSEGVGANMLDGLVFSGPGEGMNEVVVSTKSLLARWLKAMAVESVHYDNANKIPATIEEALRSDAFYGDAVAGDAAFSAGVDIELAKPAGVDFVFSALGRWAQDIGPSPLTDLVVAILKGDRVYLAVAPAKTKAAENPACAAIWKAASAKADELMQAADHASAKKKEALLNESEKASEQGDKDWFACSKAHARAEPYYPALSAEAKELADRLAAP